MFSWFASLLVLFLHGNQANPATNPQSHSLGTGHVRAMDNGGGSGTSPITDGSTVP